MSMEDGLSLIDAWMAKQQVQTVNDAIGINSEIERNNRYLGSENGFPADWLDQTPGIWSNATPGHDIRPGWMSFKAEQERRVIVAEPGGQAPDVTVNGVALRLPLIKLQSDNQSAMTPGCYPQEVSIKVSAGTNLLTARQATCMLRNVNADSK
jgi:hypothetical protein